MAGKKKGKKKPTTKKTTNPKPITKISTKTKVDEGNPQTIPFSTPTLTRIQQEKQLALEAYSRSNWEAAKIHFTNALHLAKESQPDQIASAMSSLALIHYQLQEYSDAIELCSASIKKYPRHWPSYLCRSFCYSCIKNLPLSASDYDHTSSLLQNSNLPKAKLNKILQKAQEAAIDTGSQKLKEKQQQVLEDLGSIFFTAGTNSKFDQDQSIYDDMPLLIPVGESLSFGTNIDDFRQISESEAPGRAMQAKNNGNNAFMKEDLTSALVYYSRAIQLDPNNPVFYSNRACVYLKMNRYYETITDCSASIKRAPCNTLVKAYARRAAARAALGQYDLAHEDYLKALAHEPQNQSCLHELYKCLQNIEKETKTQVEREQSTEVATVLQKKLKDIRKEIATINAKLKTPTEKKSNQTAINARRYEEIIVNCTKELMADRNSSSAYFERAKAHQALGKLDNAEKDYRDGLRIDPDNKELQQHLKMVRKLNSAQQNS